MIEKAIYSTGTFDIMAVYHLKHCVRLMLDAANVWIHRNVKKFTLALLSLRKSNRFKILSLSCRRDTMSI